MRTTRLAVAGLVWSVLTFYVFGLTPRAISAAPRAAMMPDPAVLSVMTYNVMGLPWPIATGRPAALAVIGDRLSAMRRSGAQPHIVLLQEAFTDAARQIAARAGYRYVVRGPGPAAAADPATPPLGSVFAQHSSWTKGETEGKWLDSGLIILSDYPIIATRALAFPDGACAGFDCLAAKGVVIAWIAVPGAARPVAVADTHLNSRRASGVSFERANRAQAWQLDAARRFVGRSVGSASDLIFGGDFNIGHDPDRLAAAAAAGGPLPGAREAIDDAIETGAYDPRAAADLRHIARHGRDKQFFRPGTGSVLALTDLRVPFGTESDGGTLSDHMGFIADYRLGPRSARIAARGQARARVHT